MKEEKCRLKHINRVYLFTQNELREKLGFIGDIEHFRLDEGEPAETKKDNEDIGNNVWSLSTSEIILK